MDKPTPASYSIADVTTGPTSQPVPLVTVLMTVYNGLPYLPRAIDSVLAQTMREFELLIIDDGGTDGSVELIQQYHDSRIRMIRNDQNRGQAWSLNRGVALARSPYLARLDQDDVCLPDRLGQQVAWLQRRPELAAVGCWAYYVNADGDVHGLVGMRVGDYGAFLGAVLTGASPLGHPTVMFRREVLQRVGGYDETFAPCEDYELWCRMARHRECILTMPMPLMQMRVHGQQQSRARSLQQQECAGRAQQQLVSAFAPASEAAAVAMLLRMDQACWDTLGSFSAVREAARALEHTLVTMRERLALSPREWASLNRRVRWWSARGAFLAALQGHRQSLRVYLFALRGGWSTVRFPAIWAYPIGLGVSCVSGPRLRHALGRAIAWLGHQRYRIRLSLSRRWPGRPASPPARTGPARVALLYISYDGMLEPLGQSQVLPYLRGLSQDYAVTLLSFEKRTDARDRTRLRALTQQLQADRILWRPLRYHKRPSLLATAWDVVQGIVLGWRICAKHRVQLVHARGYVAAVMAVGLKRLCGPKFLFDMRGFWADEKLDAGHWAPGSIAYRLAKRWERRFFERADAIVSLTRAGVLALPKLGCRIRPEIPVEVIPTCADLQRFSPGLPDPAMVDALGLRGCTVVGYVGTLSNWYLRHPTLRYLALLASRLDRVKILVVTREDHARLRQDAHAAGMAPAQLVLARADFAEMPHYLRLMQLGVFFIKPTFSKQASAATKLAEMVATGVPVVINDGIGDSGDIVRRHRVGVVLANVTEETFEASLAGVQDLLRDPKTVQRCRCLAQEHFDLRIGIQRYHGLYGRLAVTG